MTSISPDRQIDITTEVCPMTFVRTRLALDRLAAGQVLRVRLRGTEPLRSVPDQAAALGHTVLAVHPAEGGSWDVFLRCNRVVSAESTQGPV